MNVNEQWVNDADMFHGLVRQLVINNTDCVPSNTPEGHTQDDSTNPMECQVATAATAAVILLVT